jgi:plasmid stabilization system protein ParE
MASRAVNVVLTDRAKADYGRIRDAAAREGIAAISHFLRIRTILRDLQNPAAVNRDQPMLKLDWMLSRSDANTYVYYGRNLAESAVVVIHICEGKENIYSLLAEIVFSGRVEILTALGITLPESRSSFEVRIQ